MIDSLPDCPNLHVPREVLAAVVRIESAYNPYAIGVVGNRLARQPVNKAEAVATVKNLESRGYNYSVGMAQVNRTNFVKYGINSTERVFDVCANLEAGSKILQECFSRSGADWGKAFSCYYSGNFVTGYRHGYVQKVSDVLIANANANGKALANASSGSTVNANPKFLDGDNEQPKRISRYVSRRHTSRLNQHAQPQANQAEMEGMALKIEPQLPSSAIVQDNPASAALSAPIKLQRSKSSPRPTITMLKREDKSTANDKNDHIDAARVF